jgi:hypothetical protein
MNSVRTAKKTLHHYKDKFNAVQGNIPVYTEKHTKHIIKNADLLIVQAGRKYSYH